MSITGEFSKNSILNNLVIQRDDGYKGDNKPHYATSAWYKARIADTFGSIDAETADAGDGAFYNTGTNYVSLSPFCPRSIPQPENRAHLPPSRYTDRVPGSPGGPRPEPRIQLVYDEHGPSRRFRGDGLVAGLGRPSGIQDVGVLPQGRRLSFAHVAHHLNAVMEEKKRFTLRCFLDHDVVKRRRKQKHLRT